MAGLHKVILMLGTGGVGKTTTSLGLAWCLAQYGRKVLLLTVDPARRLYDLSNRVGVEGSGLKVVQVDVLTGFRDMLLRCGADIRTRDSIVSSRFYPYLTDSLPGFHEYVVSDIIYEAVNNNEADTIIVDTPPIQYAVRFLDAPERLQRMATTGRAVFGTSGAMPTGVVAKGLSLFLGRGFLGELSSFVSAFSEVWEGLEVRARASAELFRRNSSYGLVAVADGRSICELAAVVGALPEWLTVDFVVMNRWWEHHSSLFVVPESSDRLVAELMNVPNCSLHSSERLRSSAARLSAAWAVSGRLNEAQEAGLAGINDILSRGSSPVAVLPVPAIPGGVTTRSGLDWLASRLRSELEDAGLLLREHAHAKRG